MEFVPAIFFWQLMVTVLSILGLMSLIIGYSSNEKSFFYYTIYTFFLLFYFILITPYDFQWREQLYATPFKSLRWYSQVIYNCSYFLFFLYFLDIRTHLYKFYKFIIKVVSIAFLIGTLVFVYAMLTKDSPLFSDFYIYLFVPFLFYFAIYTLVRASAIPGKLKYFFIAGGSVFVTLGMMALFFPIFGWRFFNIKPFMFFYVGIFVEQFVFALGLGYKVKQMNLAMLEKSVENQQIKEKQNQLLEEKLKEKESNILSITLEEELSVLKLYVNIENIRFEEKIDLKTEDVNGENFSYGEIWHTTRDTYDKCPPEYMNHTSIVTAIIVYGVANLDHLLSRDGYFIP